MSAATAEERRFESCWRSRKVGTQKMAYSEVVRRTKLGDLISLRAGLGFARCSGGCCNGYVECRAIPGGRSNKSGGAAADLNDAANALTKKGWKFIVGYGWTCPKHVKRAVKVA